MMTFKFTLQLIVFFAFISSSCSLYFHLKETESKCFVQEVPNDTTVLAKYKVEMLKKSKNQFVPTVSGLGMHVEISDPQKAVILSRTYSAEGHFAFTSHMNGEHSVCIHSNSTKWFGGSKLRIHMEFITGEHAQDYKKIAHDDKLTDLQLRVRQLMDQMGQINKEQTYQRDREVKFRDLSDNTNHRVLYFSMLQVLLLVLVGFWQMTSLRNFFQAKKLV